jgi:HK97 gp10 family phage protein
VTLKKNGLVRFRKEIGAAIDRGVDRAADYVVDLAQQLAPVDEGDLKSTIRKEGEAGSRRRKVKAGGISGPNKFVDYPAFVEYGTEDSPAQPFMTPAAQAINVGAEVRDEIAALARGSTL